MPEHVVPLRPEDELPADWADFEIVRPADDDPAWHATSRRLPALTVSVVPANGGHAKIKHTRIVQPWRKPRPRYRSVLVGELGGVRLYIEGQRLILTDQELDIR